jgi:outer membrane protein TolC
MRRTSRRLLTSLLASCLLAGPAWSATLTLDDVLGSSLKHYPQILESRAGVQAQQGAVTAAQGIFDLELKNDSYARPEGFYDGRYTDTRIEKRFEGTNTRVYGGYRVSDGSFPIYEDKLFTNEGGEFALGAFFSLLRDRAIDEQRFTLMNSELQLNAAELDLLLTKISVQHAAMQAYAEWLAAGQIVQVRRDLLQIAEDRQSALSQRAERGDVANIFVTENRQYIFARRAQLNDAERQFINASNQLALYWRDANGQPQTPDPSMLPPAFPVVPAPEPTDLDGEILTAISARPEFNVLDANIAQEQNRLALGENRVLPRVDVGLETSRDYGAGSPTRAQTEAMVKLNVSIPLQRRAGEGIIAQAKARLKELEYQRRLLDDRIRAELKNILADITMARQNVELAAQEADVARTMQRAEQERFTSGASDFFVVNLREDNVANARIKQAQMQLKLFKSLANYFAATANLEKLRIAEGS